MGARTCCDSCFCPPPADAPRHKPVPYTDIATIDTILHNYKESKGFNREYIVYNPHFRADGPPPTPPARGPNIPLTASSESLNTINPFTLRGVNLGYIMSAVIQQPRHAASQSADRDALVFYPP